MREERERERGGRGLREKGSERARRDLEMNSMLVAAGELAPSDGVVLIKEVSSGNGSGLARGATLEPTAPVVRSCRVSIG